MAPSGRGRATLLAFVASVTLLSPAPASAGTSIGGIDVSQWQGDIDWSAVAAADIRFAIIRATKGKDVLPEVLPAFVDPKYEQNVAGALASGIVVGAYHRATPDAVATDARGEADYFLKHARIEAGDVLPALDIEETGGLSVDELREWVRAWLARVRARTGLRPLIYTSPNFWRTNLGDTTWFAKHGYPLWVAHWDAPAPSVPAEDWAGRGWTYWQWTVGDRGSVDGIDTAIDRDRFAGASLAGGTIASLRVTPAAGGTITGPRIACGGVDLRCFRLANPGETVELVATPDPDMAFLGWSGACAARGTSPVCSVPMRGRSRVSAAFRAVITLPQDGAGTTFRWGTTDAPGTVGGSYRWDHRAGARQTFAFEGGAISLITVAGPGMGKARIGIDGSRRMTLDGWAPRRTLGVTHRFDELGPGPHTLTVTALGIARERATGTRVGVDALRWGGSMRADPPIASGTWAPGSAAAASDGTFVASDAAGAAASLGFDGAGVSLVTARGPGMGSARILVDGVFVRTVDLFAPTRTFGVEAGITGLTDGRHVIRIIVVPPEDRPGRTVVVDGWIVR